MISSIEVCAGAGGQAIGLERAGYHHEALVEIDAHSRNTLMLNRPNWNVLDGDQSDLNTFDARPFFGIDLVSGGLPCPPFSVAGKQLGKRDERNLFPAMLRIVDETRPKAVMIENVRGFLGPRFSDYREDLKKQFLALGYDVDWKLFNASDFGVSQLRPRVIIVALQKRYVDAFAWPEIGKNVEAPSVGNLLHDLMGARGWHGLEAWRAGANTIAPTLVGGSKKHGGPDLGPTRAKQAWKELGVDGRGIADFAPDADFIGMPRLTVRRAARLQGFPDNWQFSGKKTPAYRQVGNAFPAPVAEAIGIRISNAITETQVTRAVA